MTVICHTFSISWNINSRDCAQRKKLGVLQHTHICVTTSRDQCSICHNCVTRRFRWSWCVLFGLLTSELAFWIQAQLVKCFLFFCFFCLFHSTKEHNISPGVFLSESAFTDKMDPALPQQHSVDLNGYIVRHCCSQYKDTGCIVAMNRIVLKPLCVYMNA